jgi:hypothetical protein
MNALYDLGVNVTSLKMIIQPSRFDQKTLDSQTQGLTASRCDLSISFSSTESVVDQQFVSLTILTTVSIVLSTAASLWGARAKIEDGLVMARSKIACFQKP